MVAIASDSGAVDFWNAATGEIFSDKIRDHQCRVTSVEFDPSGQKILCAGGDGIARLWDLETGLLVAEYSSGDRMRFNSATFDLSGKKIATSSDNGTVRIWNTEYANELIDTPNSHQIVCADFNAINPYLTFGSVGGGMAENRERVSYIVNSETGEELFTPIIGTSNSFFLLHATCRVFDRAGSKLMLVSPEGLAQIWVTGIDERRLPSVFLDVGGLSIKEAVFNYRGDKVLTVASDGSICVWCSETGGRLETSCVPHTDVLTYFIIDAENDQLLLTSPDFSVLYLDLVTGKQICPRLVGHEDMVTYAHLSPAGDMVATVSNDKTLRVWDKVTGKNLSVVHFDMQPDLVLWRSKILVGFTNGQAVNFEQ